jgi:N-acetylmuramoyl-L-alanine amidase
MRQRTIKLFTLIFLFCLSTSFLYAQGGYRLKTIVIDAGHGGRLPGAKGKI